MYSEREAWLAAFRTALMPLFKGAKATLPPVIRVSTGCSPINLCSYRLSQCLPASDGGVEIFVSLQAKNGLEVGVALTHALIHAAVGPHRGDHGKEYLMVARGLGFSGRDVSPSEALKSHLGGICSKLGPYPGVPLQLMRGGKGSRLKKFECSICGWSCWTTQKWVSVAGPVCPVDGEQLHAA